MNHKIGVHWIRTHGRPDDLSYVRALQPASVKLVAGDVPDVQWISDTFQAAPNTLIVLRSWAMSEQKSDMASKPSETGARHASEWRSHINRLRDEATKRALPFPPDKNLLVVGINEPEVWIHLQEVVTYTVAFLDACKGHGLKAGALNLSVGWPANNGPNQPPDWAPYVPVLAAIEHGGHYLVLHEYWADKGIEENWGWWAGRYEKCPWPVPIIIGECGIDMYVKDGAVDHQKRGWRAWANKEAYLQQLKAYHERVQADPRIHSIQVYTSDYSHPWASFDLLDVQPAIAQWASTVQPLPSFEKPGYITATAGLNMRAQPNATAQVVTTVAHGAQVTITGQNVGEWLPARFGGNVGYLFAYYVSDNRPTAVLTDTDTVQVIEPVSLVSRLAKQYGVDERVVNAVIKAESGGQGFVDGRLLIRFEPHIFAGKVQGSDVFFKTGHPAWDGNQHYSRPSPSSAWQSFHGNQAKEWAALALASMIDADAAWESVSMGAPQIMGFHYKILGYPSPGAMALDFSKSMDTQITSMFKWMHGAGAIAALADGNFLKFAEIYNGSGQAQRYADLIQKLMG